MGSGRGDDLSAERKVAVVHRFRRHVGASSRGSGIFKVLLPTGQPERLVVPLVELGKNNGAAEQQRGLVIGKWVRSRKLLEIRAVNHLPRDIPVFDGSVELIRA